MLDPVALPKTQTLYQGSHLPGALQSFVYTTTSSSWRQTFVYTTTIVESCWKSMTVGDQLASLALAALAKGEQGNYDGKAVACSP